MNYEEILVTHPSLKRDVLCYWQMDGIIPPAEDIYSRFTPKGQNLLIFNYGDDIELENVNQTPARLPFFILPAFASSQIIRQKGTIDLFGISFIGDGLYKLIQQPVSTLNSDFSPALQAPYQTLYHALQGLSLQHKADRAASFLLEHLNPKMESPSFVQAIDTIKGAKGVVKVSEIARESHVSERQLQRLFKTRMGITPKDYCKIVRVNSYLDFILQKEHEANWFDLVVAYNYHDQPHLINEVKTICKLSPKKLVKYRDTLYHRYTK